jgi:hypothetical protein
VFDVAFPTPNTSKFSRRKSKRENGRLKKKSCLDEEANSSPSRQTLIEIDTR